MKTGRPLSYTSFWGESEPDGTGHQGSLWARGKAGFGPGGAVAEQHDEPLDPGAGQIQIQAG